MNIGLRPLPIAILVMTLLTGVKTVGLVEAIGIGSTAHANTETHAAKPGEDKPKPAPAAARPPAPPAARAAAPAEPPASPPVSEAERNALQDLRERRKQLDERAAKLDERETIITAAETRLTERVAQLTALQTKLEQLDKLRHDREEENWRGLVKTYEAMRPRDAAAIFNDLDNALLIQVLDRMKEAKAAAILAAMSPERARAATTQLAQWRTQASATPHLDPSGARK